MQFTSQQNNEEYEEIVLTIGQKLRYYNSYGMISEGVLMSVNEVLEQVSVLAGSAIKYVDYISYDDLIEG